MSNEPVFIAIGIACVVAVLLFIVFIIYCVKKHQDKEETRQRRERRAREERHRRHLMRSHVVRPPPYDANRQGMFPSNHGQIPMTPPPEYKEVATPLPRNRNAVGIGGVAYPPPTYGLEPDSNYIPTISRNVAPVNTVYAGNNYMSSATTQPSYSYPNYNNSMRNNNNNTYNTHVISSNNNNNNNSNNNSNSNENANLVRGNSRNDDMTLQVRSLSTEAPTTVIVPTSTPPAVDQRNRRFSHYDAPRNHGPTSYSNHMNNRQGGGAISSYQGNNNNNNDRTQHYNTINSSNRNASINERTSFDSINRSEDRGRGYNFGSTHQEDIANRNAAYSIGRRQSQNAVNYGYRGSNPENSLTQRDVNVDNVTSGRAAPVHDPYSYYTRGQGQRGANQHGTNNVSVTGVADLSLI